MLYVIPWETGGRLMRMLGLTTAVFGVLTALASPACAGQAAYATVSIADRTAAMPAPVQAGGDAVPAAVVISRAADIVGVPVYYSRSQAINAGETVLVASRRLPAGSVFSVLLPSPRQQSQDGSALLSANMPSLMPLAASEFTSGFGLRRHPIFGTMRWHAGVDLAAALGTPVRATTEGVVNTADWTGGYGLLVALDNGHGLQTRYGHLSRLNVLPGQQVQRGDVIGFVGSTGNSTGPHLHYEIRLNGKPVDPRLGRHG